MQVVCICFMIWSVKSMKSHVLIKVGHTPQCFIYFFILYIFKIYIYTVWILENLTKDLKLWLVLNNSSCPGNKQTREECVKTHQSLVGPMPGEQADFILNWKLSIFEHWGLSCDRAWHFKIGIFALNKEGFHDSVDVPDAVYKGRPLRNRHNPMQAWFYKPAHYQNRSLIISAIHT